MVDEQNIEIEKKVRIDNIQAAFMIGVAVTVDIVQLILGFFIIGLVLNRFITFFVFLSFFLWFALNGVNFISGKMSTRRMLSFFGVAFAEFIPIVGMAPLWSFGIASIIYSTRKEDKMGK